MNNILSMSYSVAEDFTPLLCMYMIISETDLTYPETVCRKIWLTLLAYILLPLITLLKELLYQLTFWLTDFFGYGEYLALNTWQWVFL